MLDGMFIYLVSVPIYFIFLLVQLKRKAKFTTILFRSFFYFYVVAVIAVTLFPFPIQKSVIEQGIEYNSWSGKNNFIPFASIIDIFMHNQIEVILTQIGGNIILGAPLGFLIPLVWKKRRILLKTLMFGFWFSLGIEASQLLISSILGYTYRIADVDDIILNCVGVVVGYQCFNIYQFLLKKIAPKFADKLLN